MNDLNWNNTTWTAWTFKIGTKAFKEIRPRCISVKQRYKTVVAWKWWFIKSFDKEPTNQWFVEIEYDRGPNTFVTVDKILFKNRQEAEYWYTLIYSEVFLNNSNNISTPPVPKLIPKKIKKDKEKPNLTLV